MATFSTMYEKTLEMLSPRKADPREVRQIITFNTVTALILPVLIAFGINAYATHKPLALACITLFVFMICNLYLSLHSQKPQLYLFTGVSTLSIFFVYLFWTGGINNTAFLWYFIYPLVACSSLGLFAGTLASISMLFPLLYLLFCQQNHIFLTQYSPPFLLRFTIVYLLITAIAFIYQRAWEKYRKELDQLNNQLENTVEKRTLELKEANDKLKEDIATNNRINQDLNQHKEMLNKVLDTIPQSVFWKDKQGRFLGCNHAFTRSLGFSEPSKLIGLTDFDLPISKEDAISYQEYDRQVVETNEPILQIKEQITTTGGKQIWCNTSKMPLVDENGELFAVLGVFDDITERTTLEEALEKKIISLTLPLDNAESIEFEDLFNLQDIQALQDQFADATGVASIITRPDGTPLTKPSNFTRLCEYIIRKSPEGAAKCMKSDSEIGCKTADGPHIRQCLSAGLWDAGARLTVGGKHLANWMVGQIRDENLTDDAIRHCARLINADEEEAVSAFLEIPVMSKERFILITKVVDTMAGYLSRLAYQNIQQARLISDLKSSRTEQSKLQSQLTQAQKLESVGRLAGGVAHDFNNMLGVIMGNAEMTLDFFNPNPDIVEAINEIIAASSRSCDLTRQLLAFARKQTIAPRVLDLNETIEGMLRMLGRLIGENIDLTWQPYYKSCMVKVDPSQIDQVMANLCTNARDSIEGIGEIVISTEHVILDETFCCDHENCAPGHYISMSVRDSGQGITKENLDNLFEPFFTTKKVGRGTGLGLSTVFGIVQQNKGAIEVESEVGIGSTFRIYIPQCDESDAFSANTDKKGVVPGNGETLLLVEDEPAILKITTRLLTKIGYNILPTTSPVEAIEIYNQNREKVSLLVTDVIMPEMSGRQLVETLQQKAPDLKVLYVSGYTDDVIAQHGVLEEGINLINKPFTKQTLSEKVREAMLAPLMS